MTSVKPVLARANRSKKVSLGFVVINGRTRERLSEVYTTRKEPRRIRDALVAADPNGLYGVAQLEDHISEEEYFLRKR